MDGNEIRELDASSYPHIAMGMEKLADDIRRAFSNRWETEDVDGLIDVGEGAAYGDKAESPFRLDCCLGVAKLWDLDFIGDIVSAVSALPFRAVVSFHVNPPPVFWLWIWKDEVEMYCPDPTLENSVAEFLQKLP